jgi:hypothetical protein
LGLSGVNGFAQLAGLHIEQRHVNSAAFLFNRRPEINPVCFGCGNGGARKSRFHAANLPKRTALDQRGCFIKQDAPFRTLEIAIGAGLGIMGALT